MKRIKAFTIVELVMAMLISSIAIGIVYYAFLFFNKQFLAYENRSQLTSDLLLAEKALQTDIERADIVTDSLGSFIILRGNTPCDEVIYEAGGKNIVRRCGEAVDSFRIENKGMRTIYVNDSVNLVSQIVFQLVINNSHLEKSFSKQYSADQLMKGNSSVYE